MASQVRTVAQRSPQPADLAARAATCLSVRAPRDKEGRERRLLAKLRNESRQKQIGGIQVQARLQESALAFERDIL